MSSIEVTTNFKDSDGVDLGKKLITKDYLMSVYPDIYISIGRPSELWLWGRGDSGQLGNFATTNTSTPVTTFTGGSNWRIINAGNTHAAALRPNNALFTWGANVYGELGVNDQNTRSTPSVIFGTTLDWKQVSCGNAFTGAIKTDGTLWVWGYNPYGELGTNNITSRSTPVTTFAGGNDWKQVSCGSRHTAAIKTDGSLWVWGNGSDVRLGTNNVTSRSTPITTFAGGNDWKQVSCGSRHTAAIKTDGSLWIWGLGSNGRLGTNAVLNKSTPVTTFAGGNNWKQVYCGNDHTTAIKTDGTLWSWGFNNAGQLGTNNITSISTPVTTFSGGTNWKQVSCGNGHTAAIKTDGSLWAWGFGSYGRLGNFSTINRSIPVTTFAGGNDWKQVSCGDQFTFAVKSFDV